MEFAQRMKDARLATGLSVAKVTWRIRDHLPSADYVEVDVIHRIERGLTPEDKVRPALLAALAKVYGVEIAALSEVGEHGVAVMRRLLATGSEDAVSGLKWNVSRSTPVVLAAAS